MRPMRGHSHRAKEGNAGLRPPHSLPPSVVVREMVERVFAGHAGPTAIRLWDGTLAHGGRYAPCTLLVKEPGVVRELVLHPNLFRLVEAYLEGRLEVEGDFESLFELGEHLAGFRPSLSTRLELTRMALSLPRARRGRGTGRHGQTCRPKGNCRATIAHHYDRGNDFYRLWLDPELVYSCAYFASGEQPLAEAQRDKLDYICRKLRLEPGQRLLDIGCGWGALASWAARHYGVQVHGITLSEQQFRYARERIAREGLEGRVGIELLDYRELRGEARYDRVVSVGMFEHIGIRNFPEYFGTVRRVLRADGLFLNHGITSDRDWADTAATRFINRYIFPDGELARIDTVLKAMEDAGFETLDVENLRPHYAMTLRHWVRRLEARREEAIAVSDEPTYRLWRLYMAGCAFNFERGEIGIHQVLAGVRGNPRPLPLRRDWLYPE